MKVLGIETSCDETAVCVVEARGTFGPDFEFDILGNALASQATLHAQYGGVFPNLAKREHIKNLPIMLNKALKEAGEKSSGRTNIDAIALTIGPGLEPCLWTGITFAQELAAKWNVPVVGVNHMEGHIILSMIDFVNPSSGRIADFEFPVLALLISGGHTELVLSRTFGKYELVGQTRDDAAGEAFDKVARLLGLPYPGGPHVSALAERARKNADRTPTVAEKILRESASSPRESALRLPRPMMHEDNFDFSFSGLKTAVRRLVEGKELTDELKKEVAREFEDAVADVLVAKTLRAVDVYEANTLVVGGGVSANEHIRLRLASACSLPTVNCKLLIPPPELATDNAIMIALAGYFQAIKGNLIEPDKLKARGNLRLST